VPLSRVAFRLRFLLSRTCGDVVAARAEAGGLAPFRGNYQGWSYSPLEQIGAPLNLTPEADSANEGNVMSVFALPQ
jgi:hypothetical protein